MTGPPNTRKSCQIVIRKSMAQAVYWKMLNALLTKGKYSSIAVMSVPRASRKSADTASMRLETVLLTHSTIPSKIQSSK